MLVLSRKKNESIVINDDIILTVIEIGEDKVRLGIVCPQDVPVHRQEVYDAIQGAYSRQTFAIPYQLTSAHVAQQAESAHDMTVEPLLDHRGADNSDVDPKRA
jgi:carbon storage regulator